MTSRDSEKSTMHALGPAAGGEIVYGRAVNEWTGKREKTLKRQKAKTPPGRGHGAKNRVLREEGDEEGI